MEKTGHRLLYATPTGKHPTVAYCKSLHDMELTCKTFERTAADMVFTVGPVQMARSKIAEQTVEEKYDFVVMHDDDLLVQCLGESGNPLDAFHELFEKHPDVGIIGAVYLRERPNMPTVTMPHPEFPEELCHIVAGMPYAPFEVAAVGTGFMMVRRQVFEALHEEGRGMFRFSHRKTRWGTVSEVGEDYDFCVRARAKGWRVLADPRFGTVHFKDQPHKFEWHDWEAAWQDDAPGIQDRAKEMRTAVGPGPKFLQLTGGLVVIDHTPLLTGAADATQKAA